MAGKRDQHKKQAVMLPENDETFANIAGHTSGGVPYGVTWEESEAIEASERQRLQQVLPPQKNPLSLNELIGEMQMQSEEWSVYYRRSTGEFIGIKDEYAGVVEDGDYLNDRPDWEREEIERTAEVLEHLREPDFVSLPSKYEIHEYSIMEDFCHTVKNPKVANDLFSSISGKGAFRRYKDAIRRHGIQEQWHRFKDESFKEIGRQWCRDHNLLWQE